MHIAEPVGHHGEQPRAEQTIGASEIPYLLARQIAVHPVADPGDGKSKVSFLAPISISRDKIMTVGDLGDEPADVLRVVLEIAVQHDDPIAARHTHAGTQSRDLAVVSVEFDNANARRVADHALQAGERAIGRSVVNHDDLRAELEHRKHQRQFVQQFRDDLLFVIHRTHDAQRGSRRRGPG